MAAAACAATGLHPMLRAVFTADEPTDLDRAAQTVCAGCPVRRDCHHHATGIRCEYIAGIWGGRRRGLSPTRVG